MQRLVAFGCSFTYGQGLSDCRIGNNWSEIASTPNKLAWPNVLGSMLDITVINKGVPGASNNEILFHILNFDFNDDDIIVIMWSMVNRDLYFLHNKKTKKPFRQLGLWSKGESELANTWLKNVDNVDNSIKSWHYMHHANLYLKSKNLNYIHYPAFPDELEKFKPDYITLDNYFNSGFKTVDKCINDPHPGINSHIETAKIIYGILNDQ